MAVKHLKLHDIHWFGRADMIREALSLPETVVKENKQRRVSALGDPRPLFYLKQDKTHGFRNRFKRLFRDRFRTEFKTGLRLEQARIPVVNHLAWGKKGTQSYLLTQAFPGRPFSSLWHEVKGNLSAEAELVAALVKILKPFFEQSFYHPDLHGGNLLVDASGTKPVMRFVDVYGIRHQRLSAADMITMLVFVFALTEHWPPADQKKVFAVFLDFFPGTTGAGLLEDVSRAFVRRLYKWRRTRMSKYLKSSSACEAWAMHPGHVISRRETERQLVEKLFADPAVEMGREDASSLISAEADGQRFIIKRAGNDPGAGRKAWLKGISLEIMGVPVPRYLAWLRVESTGWIVREDPEGDTLIDVLAAGDSAEEKRVHLSAVARLALRLRRRGIGLDHLDLSHVTVNQNHELVVSNPESLHLPPSPPSDGRQDAADVTLFVNRVAEHCAELGLSFPEELSPEAVKTDPVAALNTLARGDGE